MLFSACPLGLTPQALCCRLLRRLVALFVQVRRFPFAIFYELAVDEVKVIAVFHSRRDPERWKSRG
jgi:plasmid stabilization system protein ParE